MEAVGGSQAYGMATPESDTDYHGVFVLPTRRVLSMRGYEETRVSKNPDRCLHEVGKFVRLAAQCNPTILEQLYLDQYEFLAREGKMLIAIRSAFLSQRVRQTYGGYARQQIGRLERREADGMVGFGPKVAKRREKHARHCFRLIWQGVDLLKTGELRVRLTKQEVAWLFEIGEMSTAEMRERFDTELSYMDSIASVLPDEPNYKVIDEVLYDIRLMNP